jgi:L-alanine-DL-glutamate epimerase-like enolase superfamily enzyme
VKVVTDNGITGCGECPSPYSTRGAIAMAGENIMGADPSDISYIMRTLLPAMTIQKMRHILI